VIGLVPGVPETVLSDALLDELPDTVAAAPWHGKARGLFWWKRLDAAGREAAASALPPELGTDLRITAAAGALISYLETPVGQYREIIGMLIARRGARLIVHVPFIAVDSRASIVGGRANWALPKTLVSSDRTVFGCAVVDDRQLPSGQAKQLVRALAQRGSGRSTFQCRATVAIQLSSCPGITLKRLMIRCAPS
jgi:hypothetical protein